MILIPTSRPTIHQLNLCVSLVPSFSQRYDLYCIPLRHHCWMGSAVPVACSPWPYLRKHGSCAQHVDLPLVGTGSSIAVCLSIAPFRSLNPRVPFIDAAPPFRGLQLTPSLWRIALTSLPFAVAERHRLTDSKTSPPWHGVFITPVPSCTPPALRMQGLLRCSASSKINLVDTLYLRPTWMG